MTQGLTAVGDDVSSPAISMEKRTRQHDWAATPLGSWNDWPANLRTTVDLMLASLHPMCVIWGPERILLYNDGYAPILGARHPDALGCPTSKVWPELWGDIAPLIDRVFAGESVAFRDQPLMMTRNGFEEEVWYDFAYSPVRDATGHVLGLLNITSDSTERMLTARQRDEAVAELSDRERFMSSVLAASTDCIKVIEHDGTLSFMSEGGMGVMEVSDFNSVKGCPWPDFLKADGPDYARAAIEAAKEGRTTHFEAPADTALGNPRYWSVSVSPIAGPNGEVARILSVSRDHTELQKAREQQQLLNGELAHRIKNMLSVVHAIASQTLAKGADRDAVRSFESRLGALARSHDILTGEGGATNKLRDLIGNALLTFGIERFHLDGPELAIGQRAAIALSLMLHELATNAVKYGALSAPDGKVLVDWMVASDSGEPSLILKWTERGGPSAIEPTRKGFGSRLIRMGLTGSGGVKLFYGKEGLMVEASAPLYQVQEA